MLSGCVARRAQKDNHTSNCAQLKNTLLWDTSLITTHLFQDFRPTLSTTLNAHKYLHKK